MNRREEVENKLDLIRAWLERTGASAVLLASQSNFAWITAGGHNHIALGEEAGVASVLVARDGAHVITTNIELRRLLDEEVRDLPLEAVEHPWHEHRSADRIVGQLCDQARAVSDLETMGLRRAGPGLVELRRTLLALELDRYRELGRATGRALESACREAAKGDTELDLAARVSYECLKDNILPLVNLVAADGRIAAYRHPLPSRNRAAHTLLAAVTGRRHGLHASATRMVSFQPPTAISRRAITRSLGSTLVSFSRPGRGDLWAQSCAAGLSNTRSRASMKNGSCTIRAVPPDTQGARSSLRRTAPVC